MVCALFCKKWKTNGLRARGVASEEHPQNALGQPHGVREQKHFAIIGGIASYFDRG
jgi:hypothetical protein